MFMINTRFYLERLGRWLGVFFMAWAVFVLFFYFIQFKDLTGVIFKKMLRLAGM